MAFSTCPKCDNTFFEVEVKEPAKSNYKLMFVQCSKCGCVVGTMDFYNIGKRINDIEKKVDSLSIGYNSLSAVNNNLNVINQNIARLFDLINRK